ncbi:hypothetical protein DSECCO2_120450 [anaerobic digester metagenome]
MWLSILFSLFHSDNNITDMATTKTVRFVSDDVVELKLTYRVNKELSDFLSPDLVVYENKNYTVIEVVKTINTTAIHSSIEENVERIDCFIKAHIYLAKSKLYEAKAKLLFLYGREAKV